MNATHALGWALVHFLWQGAALAVLLAVVLALTPPRAARTRYAFSLLTLVAMLVIPVATAVRVYKPLTETPDPAPLPTITQSSPALAPAPAHRSIATAATVAAADPVGSSSLKELLDPALPWLVALWVGGVLLLSIRLTHGWLGARRLRISGTRPASAPLVAALQQLAARLRVTRPVQLFESLIVEVPAVIGWLRPVILVPSSALSGLTPQQLEVLLAHELAHVRRYDYLVNIAQCVIETLLFYHPAVWWVSRRMREEREHCCDDLVVQVCGDAQLYASALVEMERLRPATPRLALAATGSGGSLLTRVRRLILPGAARAEFFPRWAAGVAGVVAVTIALLATGGDRVAAAIADAAAPRDTTRLSPDTVLVHPDPAQPLAQRWDWARAQARQLGKRTYWIGYTIPRPAWLDHSVYVDRGMDVKGENITISGRMYGNFQGFMFRGVRLGSLTGAGDSDDIAMLFAFTTDANGKPTLAHVHVASSYLPIDFRGRTLVWLGSATEAQSLPVVESVMAATSQPDLREDLVSAIGIHGTSSVVVPTLIRLLTSREPEGVRSQAAEWLGFHPTTAAVVALSAAARSDGSGDVRRGAAEALGDNTLPAATDSTIAIARTARDPDARRQAVEGLGRKTGDRAFTALSAIARTDADDDVSREAVETLGGLSDGRGLPVVREVARSHPRADVRRTAIETLADNLPPDQAIALMKSVATNDADPDVQRTAIEKLGDLAPTGETVGFLSTLVSSSHSEDVQRQALETLGDIGGTGLPAIIDIARTHPSAEIRRAAVEAIGDKVSPAQALGVLSQIARHDRDTDVQRQAIETLGEHGNRDSVLAVLGDLARRADNPDVVNSAIETLGDMKDGRGLAIIARIARSPGDVDARRKAMETYVENAPPDSALSLLKSILLNGAPEDLNSRVLESLEEMDGGVGIPLLIETARSNPNRDLRADALRRLAESDDPRAQRAFEGTLRRP